MVVQSLKWVGTGVHTNFHMWRT